MAREFAQIRLDIWADDDWRDLTHDAQWLYLHLLSSPALNFAGVTDWRPARIAAVTRELTAADVEVFAAELEAGDYIVVDRTSEECLIRSWVKHDGLLRNSNMCKAFVTAHAAVGSRVIRAVIVDQLHRLKVKQPGLRWADVATVMRKRAMDLDEARSALAPNPSASLLGTPSGTPFGTPSTTVSTTPSGSPSATPPATPYSLLLAPDSPPPTSHITSRSDRHHGARTVGQMKEIPRSCHEHGDDRTPGCAHCITLSHLPATKETP